MKSEKANLTQLDDSDSSSGSSDSYEDGEETELLKCEEDEIQVESESSLGQYLQPPRPANSYFLQEDVRMTHPDSSSRGSERDSLVSL